MAEVKISTIKKTETYEMDYFLLVGKDAQGQMRIVQSGNVLEGMILGRFLEDHIDTETAATIEYEEDEF